MGQSVTVSGPDIVAEYRAAGHDVTLLNGPFRYGTENNKDTHQYSADTAKLTLALIAHRLVDQGVFTLDDALAWHMPDLIEEVPFTVPLLVRHLLTESAGFAGVPWSNRHDPGAIAGRLERYQAALPLYLKPLRTAGKIAHDDPVSWALLEVLMVRLSSKTLQNLVQEEILGPLALPEKAVLWGKPASPTAQAFGFLYQSRFTSAYVDAVLRQLIRNRKAAGGRYLTGPSHRSLTSTLSLLPHPLAPGKTAGLTAMLVGDARALILPELCATAFPEAGVILRLHDLDMDQCRAVRPLLAETQRHHFPSGDRAQALAAARRLTAPKSLYGRYVHDPVPARALGERLAHLQRGLDSRHKAGEPLILRSILTDRDYRYSDIAPYSFTGINDAKAVYSTYRLGGYLYLNETLYRYTGMIGDPSVVVWPLPLALLILLSACLHWRETAAREWQRMARVGSAAFVLVTSGLIAEIGFFNIVVYEWALPGLVVLWRVLLSMGVALSLSVVIYALFIGRKGYVPVGHKALWGPLHLALLAAAGCTVFLCLIALGVAGSFSP